MIIHFDIDIDQEWDRIIVVQCSFLNDSRLWNACVLHTCDVCNLFRVDMVFIFERDKYHIHANEWIEIDYSTTIYLGDYPNKNFVLG